MKFGRFVKKAGFISVILSALIISFTSCDVEIGLGSSVDTRPPELAINYPPAGAVIRDVFTISGTCSDDGVIAGVSVDLKQTDNTALSYTMQGVFNQKEGVWSCEINPLDTKTTIPDGSYEITVTIKDSVDRETIRTRQYTIDNTAPVIAITRPSAVIPTGSDPEKYTTSNEFDSFGQDFVVEGHVADTCERRYISVDIYDLDGKLKYSTLNSKDEAQKRIKIDSDFSTTIASFGDEAYTAIYGDDDEAGTQKFFCEITVYDNARKYPVDGTAVTADDLVGNKAEYFYMYEGELYNRVFDSYGMTNAYKLLNGSYEDDGSRSENDSISPADAKKDLENKVYQETRGFLSLNPKNNPYFKVSGHEALDKEEMENGTVFDDDNNKITNNSTVVVEVYPGLDQTPLIQDNLGLYLLQADFKGNPIDSNGNVVKADEAEKIWLVRPLTDKDGSAILSEEDNAEEIAARKNLISKIGSTYKFTVYLTTKEPTANNKELAANNYYLFGVQGWDKKNVPVKNADSILGFMLVESGTAPSLTIKTITPEWITTNVNTTEAPDLVDENAVKTFSVEMAFAGDAPYRLSRIVNDGEPVDVLKISDDHRLSDYTDKYTPETGAVSGTIKYILTGSNNLTSTKEINFKVDNERPTVGEIEVPNVNVTEKSSFTFKGTVSGGDSATNSEIADVQMKLSYVAGENTVDSGWISVGNTSNWEHTVVFQEDEALKTIFAKEGSKKIEVRAIDKAGNISEVKQSSFVYDTGRPELTVQSYKMGDNAAQQIKSEFFISEAFAISGKATDTYGIDAASLKLTQVKGVGEDAVTIEIPIENINDKGEWTVGNLPRNTQAGNTNEALVATDDYTFTVSVTDLTGVKKETSATYNVSIDLEAPVVAITSPSANEIVSGDTTRITGTLDDGNGTGISGYSYKFVKAGGNALDVDWTEVATKASTFSFYKDLISGNTANATALCEGNWSLFVKVVDEAGNESNVVERKFAVDMNDPALTSAITTSSTCISQSGLYYFKGDLSGTASATDTNEPEKIKIEFKLGTEVIQLTMNNGVWTIPAARFTANTPTTLAITAYDAVGNQTKKEYQVYYDITAPSVNVAASALKNGDVVSSFPLTIYGTANDGTGIGATSIYYSLDGSAPTTELIAASSSWTKEITGTGLTEGTKTLKLKIKDALNNESEVTQIIFSYDRSDPTLTETEIGESGATVNTSITLQGTAGDTNGIDSIEITDSANEDSKWTIASSDMTESEGTLTWSKSIELGTEANTLADGRHNFTIIAKDLAGKQTKLTRSVVVDTTAPEVLTITNPATDEQATGTNAISNATYKFIGTAQDSGSGIASYSYIFTHSSTAPATGWITENAGNGEWEITKTLTAASETNCLEQGEWYLFVKATDKAGNTVAAPVSRHFWIDMGAPSVSDVNIAGGTYYFNTNTLTITGKSIDTHGLKETGAVVIKKTAVGDTAVDEVLASINASAVGSNGSWSATIAEDAIPSDGTPVTITIESTDIVGKTSGVNTYTVCKDMEAPVVTALPASNAAMAYQNNVNIQFSGTASDANLDEVKAELYKNNETTATSTTTLSPDRITGAWTWKVYDLDQASYKLKVTAKDKAGNTSSYISGSVTIDTTAPKTTVNGTALYEANGTAAEAVLSNGTVEEIEKKYAQSSYTLSGTITDANFESLVLKENGTTKTVTLTGSDWTYTPVAFTTGTEVTNNYTITVKDKANNITSYSLSVVYDTKAPEIVISSPEATYYPTVPDANGTVRDSGIGIAEVKYSTNNTSWADTGWTSGMNWSVDIATMVTQQGPVTLYIKAKDKFGNESNPSVSVSFSYDSAIPELEETDNVNGPTGNNNSFTLTGKAWDTNGLSRIEIFDQTENNTYSYKISGTTDTTPWNDSWITNVEGNTFISLTAAQASPATNNWSVTFVAGNTNSSAVNYFVDGTHQLVIKAYDVAGRASNPIYKSVFVDLNDPVIEITTPTAAASTNQTTYLFRGTIDEANLDKAIAWVYKYVDGTNDVRLSGEEGETLAPSLNSVTGKHDWSYTAFDLKNDKEYYVKVQAIDRAGRTDTETSSRVYIDNEAPTTTLTGSGLYTTSESGLASITTLANQETYYARGAYSLSGTVTENKSMSAVEVKVDNGTTETLTLSSNVWTKTGVTATDGNHKYSITLKDSAGNASQYSVNVIYDSHAPVVATATVPTTSITEGASYKFSGTAHDYYSNTQDSGLKKIEVQIVDGDENVTPSDSGWIEATGLTSWNATIVFSEYNVFSSEGVKTLCVRATDEVGNVSSVFAKNFVYDKAAPTLAVSTYTPEGDSALSISSTDNEPIFNVNGNFTLSGTSSDSNGVKDIKIYQKIGTGDEVLLQTLSGNQTANWSITGLPRNATSTSTTLTGNALASGTYTYRVVVTDNAGVEGITEATAKTESKTVHATIDKTAPVVAITNPANENSNTGLNAISVVSNRFAGTASDNHDGATDVDAVWYQIIARDGTVPAAPTASTTVDTSWTGLGFKKASNTTSWSFTQSFNSGTTASDDEHICEGRYRLVVYAVDKAGNVSTTPATQYFDVDMNAPDIETVVDGTALAESMTQTKTGAYTFKYKVTETYGLAANNPVVTMKKDNVDFIGFTQSAVDADGYVTVSITSQEDALYEYTIAATDLVGKNSTIRRNILLDTTPPALTVMSPDLSGYQNTLNVKVNGSSEDKSGTHAVWYSFGVDSMPTKPTANTTTASSWTDNGWTKADGTTSWSFSVTGVEGTDKNLYIAAVDTNGAVTTTGAISAVVKVDVNNPELSETGIGSGTKYKNANFSFSGTAGDAGSGLATTNPVTITGGATPLYPTVEADGTWSQEIDVSSLAEGDYEYTITATDNVGKVKTIIRNIVIDKSAPTLTITSPDLSGYQNTLNVKINGTSEDRTGTYAVWYSFGAASEPAIPTSNTKTDNSWTGNGWTKASGQTSWNFTVTGVEDTDKDLYIAAVDTNGTVSTSAISAVVKVDVNNPTLTEIGIDVGTQYKKAAFTLSGTASDNGSGLVTTNPVTITDGTNNYTPTFTSGNWEKSITPASDGEYAYTITAKDNSGKETTLNRTVVYDTQAPSVSSKTINIAENDERYHTVGSGNDAVVWYSTTQIPVTIAGTDSTAGVQTIECSTDHSSWNTLSKSGDNYVGTISCTSQGTNTIYIRITDKAGNTNIPANINWDNLGSWATDNTLTVHVDTLAPTTYTLGTVQVGEGTAAALTGIKLVNGRENVIFTGTASDDEEGCGIASVTLTKIGTVTKNKSATGTGPYSITIETTDMPDVSTPVNVIVTVTDNVGNTAEFTAFQMQLDNTYPTATVGTITDADNSTTNVTEVNGTITVSGTASDIHTLTGIQLQYQTSTDGTTWGDWTDYTATSNTTGSYYNWSYSINTTSFTDETYVRFRALASDEAGNTGNTGTTTQYSADNAASNKVVKVSQKTDRPVIRFTNLNLAGTNGTIWLKNTNTISGFVSDDDGDVTSLKYKLAAATDWTTLTPVTGSGYFEITGIADGQSTFYFQAADKAGKTFETDPSTEEGHPNTLNEPVLTDGTNKIENGTVALTLKVDKTKPEVRNKQYQIFDRTKGNNEQWGNFVNGTWQADAWGNLTTLGGNYTKLKVKLEAADQNAITSVTSTFGGNTIDFTCSETHDDDAYYPWATGEISIPTEDENEEPITEVRNLEIVVTDGAGLTTTEVISVEIDNSAPVITIQEPSSLIGTTETIRGNIATTNASESRDAKLYYAVSRYDATANNVKPLDSGVRKDTDNTTVLATAWTEIQGLTTTLNWYVYFDDQTTIADHTVRFAKYLTEAEGKLGITTEDAITNNTYTAITDLYFWLKAVDSMGNTSCAYQQLHVDPQGDRPSVTLIYPSNNNDGSVPTLGGSIRLSGSAEDNEQAKYVWVQIDKNNNGTFDATDLAFMNTNNGTARTYGYKLGQISTNTEKSISEIAAVVTAGTNIEDYGIMVDVQGTSWNTTVNNSLEYSPTSSGSQTATIETIKFIIYATDDEKNKSLPVIQTINLDADSPVISQQSLKLVQYLKNGAACTDGSQSSGTIANEMEYSEGMSIKGIWYLTGEVTDPSGIKEIWIDNVQKVASAGVDYPRDTTNDGIILTHENFGGNANNYKFKIRMGNNTTGQVGSQSVVFKAIENTTNNLPVQKTFSIDYDNKAPEIITEGNNVSLSTNIVDSSGFFTFGAVAKEDAVGTPAVSQSGVERIAFYFTRDLEYNIKTLDASQYSGHSTSATQTHDLFDVMISSENWDADRTVNSATVQGDVARGNMIIDYASGGSFANGIYTPGTMKTNYVYEDYLVWEKTTGTISGQAVTLTSVGKNVHIGGLVKIKGAIYKITGITGSTINISGSPGNEDTAVQVLCAIAGVVDSTDRNGSTIKSTKGYGYGYYSGNSLDNDNDLLIETFNKTGSSWSWDVAIKSTNIPDGPVTLHIVAIDKAGNASEYKYNATVNNNGPRIAGMSIGTDENGNGDVDDTDSYSEFDKTSYHNIYANGKQGSQKITSATFPVQESTGPSSAITAKGQVEIIPEIIGGNGALKYTYDVFYRNTANNDWNITADYRNTTPTSLGTGNVEALATISDNITISVEDFVKPNTDSKQIEDGANRKFSFNIGDNTPARTANGASQNVTLNVIMDVALRDTNAAKNYILPFYWNSATSNSLFDNSKDNGHIELATDWVLSAGYANNTTTGEYDNDPKVSGKIKIEGIAQDDILLEKINVQFGKAMGGMGITDTTIATYSNGSWTPKSSLNNDGTIPTATGATKGWAAEVKQATYGELLKVGLLDENEAAKVTDDPTELGTTVGGVKKEYLSTSLVPETSQKYGHVVHWILYLDTAYVENVAATDVTVTATAIDKGKPTWGGSSVGYTPNTAAITNNSSGYSCAVTKTGDTTTSEGAYTGKYKMDVVPYITGLTRPDAKTKTHRSRRGKYQVVLSESVTISGFNLLGTTQNATTGAIKLQTTGNQNGDTVKTSITAANGSTSNSMTFTVPATSGFIKVVTNNVSSINNFNANSEYNEMESEYSGDEWYDDVYLNVWKNDEYFHFSNDPISPSMDRSPNGKGQYRLYGGWGTNGSRVFASYPYTKETNTNAPSGSKPTSTGNAPGPNNGGGNTTLSSQNSSGSTAGYGDPISYYDVVTDENGNRYNLILDCWQGSGAGWGGNFVINRNGYSRMNGFNSTYNFGSDEMRHVIERMGSGKAPDSAESADGFDEIFNQFLNPRITLYNGSAYITYYDRYAKCLKWAMSTPADSRNVPVTKYSTEGVITSSTYSTNHYKTGGMVVAGYDTLQTGGSYTNLNVGLWSDIAIDSTAKKPVIAYYDGTNRQLKIATSAGDDYPVNTNSPILANGTTTTAPANGEGNAWTRQVVTGSAALRLGEYVSLALDGGNNIHIACKGAQDGALYYVYGARSAYGTYVWTTVCVDNNGSPGNWTDIKLTTPSASGAAAGPVISYYDPTNDATEDALKVAYFETPSGTPTNPHLAAENWDTMIVPCNSAATANRITLALDVTDGVTYTDNGTTNNSKLAVGYVSSRFDCVYLRKE